MLASFSRPAGLVPFSLPLLFQSEVEPPGGKIARATDKLNKREDDGKAFGAAKHGQGKRAFDDMNRQQVL